MCQQALAQLELLAQQDDCPICLEPLAPTGGGDGGDAPDAPAPPVVLGCCHKVCGPCWRHWLQLKGRGAFCPLCRNDEFLGNVVEGRGVPAALYDESVARGGIGAIAEMTLGGLSDSGCDVGWGKIKCARTRALRAPGWLR